MTAAVGARRAGRFGHWLTREPVHSRLAGARIFAVLLTIVAVQMLIRGSAAWLNIRTAKKPTDVDPLRRVVHYSLLGGVTLSGLVLVIGLSLGFNRVAVEQGQPPPVPMLLRDALAGQSTAVLNVGLLILMLTPLVRVATLSLGWAIRRQWLFAAVAGLVLALLLLSMSLGVG